MSNKFDILNDVNVNKWSVRNTSGITDITIHHTASPTTSKIETFRRYHKEAHNWPDIAYHYVIDAKGVITQTNKVSSYTYHNGFNNKKAIGIAIIGDYEKDKLSSEILLSLLYLILKLKKEYPSIKNLMGHKEYKNSTICPGKNVDLDALRIITNLNKLK
jgi:N-acetyl-anhydromuramyl-L-alanine amidase AmpD